MSESENLVGPDESSTKREAPPEKWIEDLFGVKILWGSGISALVAALLVAFAGGEWLYDLLPLTIAPIAALMAGCFVVLVFWAKEWAGAKEWTARRPSVLCMTYLMVASVRYRKLFYLFRVIERFRLLSPNLPSSISAALMGGIAVFGIALSLFGFFQLGWSLFREEIPHWEKPPRLDRRSYWGFRLAVVALVVTLLASLPYGAILVPDYVCGCPSGCWLMALHSGFDSVSGINSRTKGAKEAGGRGSYLGTDDMGFH